jgi:uncharacterized membrane protein
MTARELLRLVIRRWYLMLVGAAITIAALYLATHRPGVYWTQFNVVVLAPVYEYYPNNLADAHYALGPTAGVLVTDWNGEHRPLLTASGDTTLFGEGKRQAIEIRMPNEGTQWLPLYYSPKIDVQVVDSDPAKVAREAQRVGAELNGLLERRQDALAIRPSVRMTTIMSPAEPTVSYMSGSPARAALAIGLVGAILTTVAVYWIERWSLWRHSRKLRNPNHSGATLGAST